MRPSRTLLAGAAALLALAALAVWRARMPAEPAPRRTRACLPGRDAARTPAALPASVGEATRSALSSEAPTDAAPGLLLSGRVLAPGGEPEAGATVWLTRTGASAGEVLTYGLCDAQGLYRLEASERELTLHAAGREHGEAARALSIPAGAREHEAGDLVLGPGGVLRGRVLGMDGEGLPNVQLQAWALSGPVWSTPLDGHVLEVGYRAGLSAQDGSVALTGLRAVPHAVRLDPRYARQGTFEPLEYPEVLPGGEELIFRQLAHGRVRAQLIDQDTRLPITTFRVFDELHHDPEGRFERPFDRDLGVGVSAPGYFGNWWTPPADLAPGATVDALIELQRLAQSGTLRILAVDELGAPVPGLRLQEWRGLPLWESEVEVRPGEILARSFLIGARRVLVDAPGHAALWIPVKLAPGETHEEQVVLERGARARLRVYDERGLVAQGYSIEVDGQRRKERDAAWVCAQSSPQYAAGQELDLRTNSGRQYEYAPLDGWIANLPAGAYELLVHLDATHVESFEFEIDVAEPREFAFRVLGRR
jgi:hypothetical protein